MRGGSVGSGACVGFGVSCGVGISVGAEVGFGVGLGGGGYDCLGACVGLAVGIWQLELEDVGHAVQKSIMEMSAQSLPTPC